MAAFVLKDASVVLNSVDISDHVASVTLDLSVAEVETTAMGDDNITRIGGLKDGSLALELHQDFAASETDATINGAFGTVVSFTVKATSDAVSATNPSYSGSVLVSQHTPVANGVGELATQSLTFPLSGAVTRATS